MNDVQEAPSMAPTSSAGGPDPSPAANPEGWSLQLAGLGVLLVAGLVLALVMPWQISSYQLTQWLVFGDPTVALRALPSLLTHRFVDLPASEADLRPIFLGTLVALNLLMGLATWLMLRRSGNMTVVMVGLFGFTGLWYLINTAIVPSTDPLMYLPAALGLLLTLLFGSRRWLVPVLWLLAAAVLYVHPAGLFSAIPALFAAHLLLRPRADWSWRDLGLLLASIVVVALLVLGGRSIDPPRPAAADVATVLSAEIASVQARAEFPINEAAVSNLYRSVGDILAFTVQGQRDYHGVFKLELPRWRFTIPAVLLLLGKLALLFWLLPWRQLRAALTVWNLWQHAIAAGAVLVPLVLILFGTDYHRWLGFVDLNLTVVLLVLLAQARADGHIVRPNTAALPVVVGAFLFQIVVSTAASRLGIG